ncbi:MAG: hypothetical protein KatS3mg126_1965 [Lysobacteraceae bacterium]|nr:MAG: hypothetical protein KatS3mg126_1965 [Xanthomonadaceae bacterium]
MTGIASVGNLAPPASGRTGAVPASGQGPDEALADPAAQAELARLAARDREVRAHEQAHLAAGGPLVTRGPSYTYRTGPDGRRYAVGGEVGIDTSPVRGDPQATLDKAQRIRAAALAPARPSAQDQAVAAEAARMETAARAELARQQRAVAYQAEAGPSERYRPGALLQAVA